jgi:hypothetical protein
MRRMAGWVKRADRASVHLSGSLRFRNGQRHMVTITDVSPDGCKLFIGEMLPIGSVVLLDLPGQETVRASVRWSMVGKAGLLFLQPERSAG